MARHFGVKAPSVTGWVKHGRIGKDRLYDLMGYFSDVAGPEHWGMAPPVQNIEPASVPPSTRTAPVISWVQAGDWSEAIDLHQPGIGDDYEAVPAAAGENVFWLRVVGDSMTAPAGVSVPEGHLILVDPDRPPVSGSLVVAKLVDSDEVTFKRLVIDAGQKYLKPLNPDYKTIPINGNCKIVGVVIEAKIKF